MIDYKKEADDFAYTISTCFAEQLNTIHAAGDAVCAALTPDATDNEAQYIEFLHSGITKAETLISGLATYAACEVYTNKFTHFKTQSIIDSPYQNHAITHTNLPETLYGHQESLKHLLTRLMDNAIKFQDKTRALNITLSCDTTPSEHILCLRDNGIGIADHLKPHAFTIFRRNSDKSYDGAGVGLTICEKIIAHHGGRIWIESTENQGTSVFFTLPYEQKT